MKLRPHNSTQPQISRHEVVHESEKTRRDVYVHPWYEYESIWRSTGEKLLKKPDPPTQEAVDKAKFVDKTYTWKPK